MKIFGLQIGKPTDELTQLDKLLRAKNILGPRHEPSNISSTATAKDVQQAIREAENGSTESLFRFYRDSLLGDDHIQGELSKRKLAMLSQPLAVMPADKENKDDIAAAAAARRMIADCENWSDGLADLLSSCLWPVSSTQKIFRPADPVPGAKDEPRLQFTLKRLEPVNPLLFCFRFAYEGGTGVSPVVPGVSRGTGKGEIPPRPISAGRQNQQAGGTVPPDQWEPWLKLWPTDADNRIIYDTSKAEFLIPEHHIVHRGHLLTGFRDNWGGPMRCILGWWLLRQLGRDWFGRFMERYGSPFPVAKTNTDDPEAIAFLENALKLCTKVGGLVIGQDDHVELVAAMVQGGAEGYRLWLQTCNDAMSFAITGIKSGDKPAGMNAGEETMVENVRQDIRLYDQMKLGETLEKQLFKQFFAINGVRGRVVLVWGGQSSKQAKETGELLQSLSSAGLEPTDEAIPTLSEKVGFALQRKAPPEPQSGFGGALEKFSARFPLPSGERTKVRGEVPSDQAAEERAAALAAEWKISYAPLRLAILSSTSKADLEERLRNLAPHLVKSERVKIAEEVLQIAAAKGAGN